MTEEERRPPWYFSPYLHLGLNAALVTISQLLLKTGTAAATPAPAWLSWTGIAALGSGWVLAGILCYLVSFVNWLYVLRSVPLHIAYPVSNLSHALIPLGAWGILGERFGPLRAAGIVLIIVGTWFVARRDVRMTLLQLGLVVLAQVAQVAGQVLLKQAMTRTIGRASRIAAGMAMLAFWFFAWLKLLQGLDLSYLYPFEGLSLVLLVFAARIFLGERTRRSTGIGVALIVAGMILVGLN